MKIPVPVVDGALQASAALLNLIEKALPSELERLERHRGKAPLRALNLRGKAFRKNLREIRKLKKFMAKYNLTEAELMKYYELTEKISTTEKSQHIP